MIVVLGGTGILGSNLVLQLLEKGESLRLLYRTVAKREKLLQYLQSKLSQAERIQNITWYQGDIRTADNLNSIFENASQVYHCANKVSFDERDRNEMLQINHIGTQNVVNKALEFEIEKLAYVSSIATLSPVEGENLITETNPWEVSVPHSSYEESKYLGELEVWRGIQEGLKAVIIKPGVILSDYDFYESSGEIFSIYHRKIAFILSGSVPFVDVNDVAERLLFLMNAEVQNESYLLVGQSMKYKEFVPILRKTYHLNKAYTISDGLLNISKNVMSLIATFVPFVPRYSNAIWSTLTSRLEYSTDKIQKIYPKPFNDIPEKLKLYAEKFITK